MPDWNKLHKEIDDALESMSDEMFRTFYIKSKADSLTERFYYTMPNNGSLDYTEFWRDLLTELKTLSKSK